MSDTEDILTGLELVTGTATAEEQWARLLPSQLVLDGRKFLAHVVKHMSEGLVYQYVCPNFFPDYFERRGLYVTVKVGDDFPSIEAANAKIETAMMSLRSWADEERRIHRGGKERRRHRGGNA